MAYEQDAALAAEIAEEAGALLLDLQKSGTHEGRELGNEGDRRANVLILERLRSERPDDAVLSEESADTKERLSASRVWIVDPLDGTREYSEGREDWAVHIALAVDGRPVAGAVALPARAIVLRSDRPHDLKPERQPLRIAVSRTRDVPEAAHVADRLGAQLLKVGSAGAKTAAVMLGEADAYLHSGGQREWDSCAPVAVAQAAGLHCSRIDGSELLYNQADVVLPDLIVCHPERADELVALSGEVQR